MSLNSSRNKLHANVKELMARWERAKAKWDDTQCRDFEKRHLEPLEPKVRHAAEAMERMATVLARAKRECGPE